jgi:hypothetical protein
MVSAMALALGFYATSPAYAQQPLPPGYEEGQFQGAVVDDSIGEPDPRFQVFPVQLPSTVPCPDPDNEGDPDPACGAPELTPIGASMTAVLSGFTVSLGTVEETGEIGLGQGIIGGDILEFDVTITNTSPAGSGAVLTAFAFQSKFSESPALASRIGDKLYSAEKAPVGGTAGPMVSVKKNGTSNGLFTGKWKGICINSSTDYVPQFNAGIENESLECAGGRTDVVTQDADGNIIANVPDGQPELAGANPANAIPGLLPGQSQVIRLRLDSGTTDGALHIVQAGTITGTVGPDADGLPSIVTAGTALELLDIADNKVFRNAAGEFDPSFAPAASSFSLAGQSSLTFPRRHRAFKDILGRNHSCGVYGLDLLTGIPCSGKDEAKLVFGFLGTGDLVPGVQNFAALLRGFGEFYDANGDFVPDCRSGSVATNDCETRPLFPYEVLCENCGGKPYVPIAEFYVKNDDGQTVTRELVAGTWGALTGSGSTPYTATINDATTSTLKQEIVCIKTNKEFEPANAVDPNDCSKGSLVAGPDPGTAFGARATAVFRDLVVTEDGGLNKGDTIEFTVDITNESDPGIYLTSFNYQTKRRGLADINILDGTSQLRWDLRLADPAIFPQAGLELCTNLDDEACWNSSLGIGQFPNVIGNGLLFGQMVWTDADAGREADPVDSDQVFVASTGINPTPFFLESVKKNGPFSPIFKGNVNFICIKSGLFQLDPDADTSCAGEPAEVSAGVAVTIPDADDVPVYTTVNNPQRLGIPPGGTQSVRMRQDFGDFRGVLVRITQNALTTANIDPSVAATLGLKRFFDCSDQREVEYCHPSLIGQTIGYLPNTIGNPEAATWLTPALVPLPAGGSAFDVRYVILNQPGNAATVMNFEDNFGFILAMAGFRPSAEFYKPDPRLDGSLPSCGGVVPENLDNPGCNLAGLPEYAEFAGALIRQQVVGQWTRGEPAGTAPVITSNALPAGEMGLAYSFDVQASGFPAPSFSLTQGPTSLGLTINSASGVLSWPSPQAGTYNVTVKATNGAGNASKTFALSIAGPSAPQVSMLDNFNRTAASRLTGNWAGALTGYGLTGTRLDVKTGGIVYWKTSYGASQAAQIALTTIAPASGESYGVLLKWNPSTGTGVKVAYIPSSSTGGTVSLQKRVSGAWQTIATQSVTVASGSPVVLTGQVKDDGKVNAFINGAFVKQASAGSQFASSGGYIGLSLDGAPNAFADDFKGGNVQVNMASN